MSQATDDAPADSSAPGAALARLHALGVALQLAMAARYTDNRDREYAALADAIACLEEDSHSSKPMRPDRALKILDGVMRVTFGHEHDADPQRLRTRCVALHLHLIGKE